MEESASGPSSLASIRSCAPAIKPPLHGGAGFALGQGFYQLLSGIV
jgi:hypothetical protein